jgi:hypothetical protein
MEGKFQPDIYPIMYWGIAYGAIAGVALFILFLLARFITLVWFPVFLAGLIYGGYRNYQKQKLAWHTATGTPVTPASPMDEFKEAASDIYEASQNLATQEAVEETPEEQLPPTPPTSQV